MSEVDSAIYTASLLIADTTVSTSIHPRSGTPTTLLSTHYSIKFNAFITLTGNENIARHRGPPSSEKARLPNTQSLLRPLGLQQWQHMKNMRDHVPTGSRVLIMCKNEDISSVNGPDRPPITCFWTYRRGAKVNALAIWVWVVHGSLAAWLTRRDEGR